MVDTHREVVDKAVEKLRQNVRVLQPAFVEDLRDSRKDAPGWEFIRGPGSPGWEYFVQRMQPLYEEVCRAAVHTRIAKGTFLKKFLEKEKKAPAAWRAAAEARAEAPSGYDLPVETDSSRLLKISNFSQAVKPKLFLALAKYGVVEYTDFEAEAAKTVSGKASHTCTAQYLKADQAQKVLSVIMKLPEKKRTFQVALDDEGMLRGASPVLLLSSVSGVRRKVSDFAPQEIADVFSLFSAKPPSVIYEDFGTDQTRRYDSVIITYDHAADAEEALKALQGPLAGDALELHYLTEEGRADMVGGWLKDGSSVGGVYHGGERVPLEAMEPAKALRQDVAEGSYLDEMNAYKLLGDDTLERARDIDHYCARYWYFFKENGRLHRDMALGEKGDREDWSEEPGIEFSAFRLRRKMNYIDEKGRVERAVVSPDYAYGTYLHLPGNTAGMVDDDEFVLAIDNEEDEDNKGLLPLNVVAQLPGVLSKKDFRKQKREKMLAFFSALGARIEGTPPPAPPQADEPMADAAAAAPSEPPTSGLDAVQALLAAGVELTPEIVAAAAAAGVPLPTAAQPPAAAAADEPMDEYVPEEIVPEEILPPAAEAGSASPQPSASPLPTLPDAADAPDAPAPAAAPAAEPKRRGFRPLAAVAEAAAPPAASPKKKARGGGFRAAGAVLAEAPAATEGPAPPAAEGPAAPPTPGAAVKPEPVADVAAEPASPPKRKAKGGGFRGFGEVMKEVKAEPVAEAAAGSPAKPDRERRRRRDDPARVSTNVALPAGEGEPAARERRTRDRRDRERDHDRRDERDRRKSRREEGDKEHHRRRRRSPEGGR
eukprot:TRINITY_DN13579_c0_g1_i1.p1 TRINITY_DN13579_c0_g1~~TRINITY_DN13579_c0_g1_i1.p1  ORF type:complete len:848 (+),score=365.65 TRINITY_DN13579_c0_g1_i1:75-2546(+)